MSDKTAKKPSPVVQKKDKNVLRGEAPERRNEIAREMFMRSWGGGKHHNPQDYARGKGRNPKHKGQRSDRSWEGMTSPMARFEEGVSADPTVNMTPQQAAEWKKQNAIHRDQFTGGEAMRNPMARFEEGVSADPTANMSPEDAAKWNAMNEAHRDQFKAAARYSKDPYWMVAKYPGKDADGKPFRKGERVFYYPLTKTILTGAKADRASAEFDAASFDEDYGFRAASGPDDEKDYKIALRRLAVAKKALQRIPVTMAENLNKQMREFDNRTYDLLRATKGSTYTPADPKLIAEAEEYRTEVLQALAALKDITLGKGAVRADLWDSVRKLPTINQRMEYMGEVTAFANILAKAAVIIQLKAEQAKRSVDYLTKWVEFYDANGRAPTYGEQRGWVRLASNSLAAAWGPVLSRTAKGLEDSCWEGYTAVGMKEMGGKQVPNCVPAKQASLADLWGNLMLVVADAGSPEADKAGLKKDADPKSHDQNLASTWEKVAGGSGAANAAFLKR